MTILCYNKCSTCKKAEMFLKENNIEYEFREITIDNPKQDELDSWINKSGLDIKRFFNTSGILYRENKIAEKYPSLTYEEKLDILASDGKMVKRPILVTADFILVGFKEEEWKNLLS